MTPVRHDVVTLGEAMLRLSTPGSSRLETARELDIHVGGSESNVAVTLARLGTNVAWLSCLPETPLGRRIAAEVALAGVDTSHVVWKSEGRVGLYFVEFGVPPRSTTVWYDRAGSAINQVEVDELNFDLLAGAKYAVLSGITPALSPNTLRLSRTFLDRAREFGVKICLDVNYRARLWSIPEAREVMAELLNLATVVVCNERDALWLFTLEGTDEQIVTSLRERWCPRSELAVLTQSERGCVASYGAGEVVRQEPFPASVVDRFGAGDAFVGGLIWGLLNTDVRASLRAGAAVAALKCTTHGDHVITSRAEVEALMSLDNEGYRGVVR